MAAATTSANKVHLIGSALNAVNSRRKLDAIKIPSPIKALHDNTLFLVEQQQNTTATVDRAILGRV
jgi:hypothetical protein